MDMHVIASAGAQPLIKRQCVLWFVPSSGPTGKIYNLCEFDTVAIHMVARYIRDTSWVGCIRG